MVNILAHWFSVLFLAPFPAYFPSFCALPTRLNYSVALLISTWFYQEHVKSYSFQSSVFGARIGRRFFFGWWWGDFRNRITKHFHHNHEKKKLLPTVVMRTKQKLFPWLLANVSTVITAAKILQYTVSELREEGVCVWLHLPGTSR